MITWDSLFEYDPDSPSFLTNKVNRPPRAVVREHAGYVREDGYWLIGHNSENVLVHRIIYELFNGPIPEGMQVDHIDGNPSNNAKENLRLVPREVNQRNMRKSRRNTSGFTGVSKVTVHGRKGITRYYWTAFWKNLDNTQGRANFSVEKLGEDVAKGMAVARRQEEINKLNESGAGYSERHGK